MFWLPLIVKSTADSWSPKFNCVQLQNWHPGINIRGFGELLCYPAELGKQLKILVCSFCMLHLASKRSFLCSRSCSDPYCWKERGVAEHLSHRLAGTVTYSWIAVLDGARTGGSHSCLPGLVASSAHISGDMSFCVNHSCDSNCGWSVARQPHWTTDVNLVSKIAAFLRISK